MARVKPEELRGANENDLVNQTREYSFAKKQVDYFEKKQKELREKLFEHIETEGESDSDGHIVLELPEEIDGYRSIKKQRRVTRKINEDVAKELIALKGMEDTLYKTIQVVDEDALMAALYNGELTEDEIDLMYPQQIVWALVMNKR